MHDFTKSATHRLSAGWILPLVLLALPGCIIPAYEYIEGDFDPGLTPRSSAIMCDIPKPASTQCATDDEIKLGINKTRAAVALANGERFDIGLDYSQESIDACGGPRKTEYFGPFPDGYTVCLNCEGQMPRPYVDGNAACIAVCKDLIKQGEGPEPDVGVDVFCAEHARVSTNFDKNTCYDKACSDGGTPLSPPDFVDPRRFPEPVKWVYEFGALVTGNTVTRNSPTGGFDAGAAAAQVITTGDAWVEFEAGEGGVSHVLGVSTCVSPCQDGDPQDTDATLADIGFALSLNYDGNLYQLENGGQLVNGPGPNGEWGTYVAGERFRLHVEDNHNGTATISFWRVLGPCAPGEKCAEEFITGQSGPSPNYPLRIDASFRETSASLKNVNLVRIQKLF